MVDGGKPLPKQFDPAHGHPYAGLGKLKNQLGTGNGYHGGHGYNSGHVVQSDIFKHISQRVFNVHFRVINHARQHQRDGYIQDSTDQQTPYHRSGQVTLRVPAFFGGSGYGIKTDKSKKYGGNST